MILLSVPFDPAGPRRMLEPWPAVVRAGIVVMAACSAGLLVQALGRGWLSSVGHALASAAVHGGLLAIGWIVAVGHPPRWRKGALWLAGILALASVASRFTPWGSLLYLALPILFLRAGARHAALRWVGVGLPAELRPVALGLAAGAFLGAHLLVSASMTLGYGIRIVNPGQYLAAAAYDLGANALSAEWLFRGALFSHWWRRWEFWPAASASTGLVVLRYLLDPALPGTIEVRAGAVFYMTLLGFCSCALRASSGSLLPGYLATTAFFLAYRMLIQ